MKLLSAIYLIEGVSVVFVNQSSSCILEEANSLLYYLGCFLYMKVKGKCNKNVSVMQQVFSANIKILC